MIDGLLVSESAMDAVTDADAIGLITEWPEFVAMPWAEVADAVRGRIVVDGRNALDPEALVDAGFVYSAFGRGQSASMDVTAATSTMHVEPSAVEVEPVGLVERSVGVAHSRNRRPSIHCVWKTSCQTVHDHSLSSMGSRVTCSQECVYVVSPETAAPPPGPPPGAPAPGPPGPPP